MKRLAIAVCSLFALDQARSQGTVNFVNDSGSLSPPPDHLLRFCSGSSPGNPFGTNGAPAVGTNIMVQLYYGTSTASESQLIPVSSSPARLRSSTTVSPGVWTAGGMRTLNNFDYGSGEVKLQVRVWSIEAGATYEQAWANGNSSALNSSATFLYTMPASPLDNATNFVMRNFHGFTVGYDEAPYVVSLPSQTVVSGEHATFDAWVYANAPVAAAYTWWFNGTIIPGATTNRWTVTNAQPANAGVYSVQASNACGSSTRSAQLTVISPALAIRHPNASNVEVAWVTNLTAYVLESASDPGSVWASNTRPPTVRGQEFIVTEGISPLQRFFRLRKP